MGAGELGDDGETSSLSSALSVKCTPRLQVIRVEVMEVDIVLGKSGHFQASVDRSRDCWRMVIVRSVPDCTVC